MSRDIVIVVSLDITYASMVVDTRIFRNASDRYFILYPVSSVEVRYVSISEPLYVSTTFCGSILYVSYTYCGIISTEFSCWEFPITINGVAASEPDNVVLHHTIVPGDNSLSVLDKYFHPFFSFIILIVRHDLHIVAVFL